MTLSIFSPAPSGPLGPGIQAVVQLANVDPPAGSSWFVEARDNVTVPTQTFLRHQALLAPSGNVFPSGIIGNPAYGQLTVPSFRFTTHAGSSCQFVCGWINGSTGAIVEELAQPQIWDASFQFLLNNAQLSNAGFTQLDRDNLTIVKASVFRQEGTSPISGLPVVSSVIDFLRGPSRALLRPGSSQLLTGRGVLGTSDPSLGVAFGGTWSWFTVPAEFGFIDGQLDEYFNRMAQFLVIREGARPNPETPGTLYIDEVVDSNAEGGFVTWKIPAPTEVQYDIAPGLAALWRWLV